MELEAHIFDNDITGDTLCVTIRIPKKDISTLFKDTCYLALKKIKDILLIDNMEYSVRIDKLVDIMIQLEGEADIWDIQPTLDAAVKK